jgi:hypothetical protein
MRKFKLLSSGLSWIAAKLAERRAYVALVGAYLVFVIAVGITLFKPLQTLFSTTVLNSESEAEMRTGTIRFTPTQDDLCRELEFDNPSGRFRDKGLKPCGEPAPKNQSDKPITTFDKIRDSFNNR